MTLVTVADVRHKVETGLTDVALEGVIEDEEAEVIRRYGAHGDGVITVTEARAPIGCELFLSRPAVSVTSIAVASTLGGSTTALLASAYHLWPAQGRLIRLPQGAAWEPYASVVYVPVDDQARRKRVIIELVRLALEQTAMQSEGVAGEYSFTAPDWEKKRAQLYSKLQFTEV